MPNTVAYTLTDTQLQTSVPVDAQCWVNVPSNYNHAGGGAPPVPVYQDLIQVPEKKSIIVDSLALLVQQLGEVADVIWMLQGRTADTVNGGPLFTNGYLRCELLETNSLNSMVVESPLSWVRGSSWQDYKRLIQQNTKLTIKLWNWFDQHDGKDYSGDIVVEMRLTGQMINAALQVDPSSSYQGGYAVGATQQTPVTIAQAPMRVRQGVLVP